MSLVPASKATVYLATLRAIESNRRPKGLINDPFAKLFLPLFFRMVERVSRTPKGLRFLERYIDKRWTGALTCCAARTRLIDVMTTKAVEDSGVNQVIIFGAGYDCRAHRLQFPARIQRMQFVEVDHPAIQSRKQQILHASALKKNEYIDYVPVDFHNQDLISSIPPHFQKSHYHSLLIWESVTNSLSPAETDKLFKYFGSFKPGTMVIFMYVDEKVLSQPASFHGAVNVTKLLNRGGELWNFGLDPGNMHQFLSKYNMQLLHDYDMNQTRHFYYGDAADRMKGYEYYRVAMAVVR
jgi:methyltransferase (TIGR00027 family)